MREVTISIYFMWEWWEKHFHCIFKRPEKACDEFLEWMYLKRKRFLFENFSEFGVGEENPVMDGRYVNMVLKWGMDFIPYVLGAKLTCCEIGGYKVDKMDLETIKKLKSVDIASSPAGQWIIQRKNELIKRYGSAEQAMDLESPTNVSVRIRGEEFYMDLIQDKELAVHILDIVTETICNTYTFIGKEFRLNELLIGNCNVTLMSPKTYEEIIQEYDIKLASIAEKVTGKKNSVRLHHCDVPVDSYIEVYKKIPNVFKLEASQTSNIKRVQREMPGVMFAAMVNPLQMMQQPLEQLGIELEHAIRDGAGEIDLWNVDPSIGIDRLTKFFHIIRESCEKNQCRPVFDVIPFCWDEIEWAFPMYMP